MKGGKGWERKQILLICLVILTQIGCAQISTHCQQEIVANITGKSPTIFRIWSDHISARACRFFGVSIALIPLVRDFKSIKARMADAQPAYFCSGDNKRPAISIHSLSIRNHRSTTLLTVNLAFHSVEGNVISCSVA